MPTKFLITIALISLTGVRADSTRDVPDFDLIRLEDTYAVEKSIYRWERVPVLFGRSAISHIDSSRPIIPCERVLKGSAAAQALLKQIFQEQEEMLELIESLKGASPEEIERLLHRLRAKLRKIEVLQERLPALYPPEFQEKDRVRTLSWDLKPSDFVPASRFPKIPKIEWAQLEVLAGDGGWFGTFLTEPSAKRPTRQRFEEFVKLFERDPAMQRELRRAFGLLLKEINEQFAEGTPGSHGMVDWQGGDKVIQLMQELSPVEACVPHVALTSSLLLDLEFASAEEYPSPEYPSTDKTIRLGMGPLLLTYYEVPKRN